MRRQFKSSGLPFSTRIAWPPTGLAVSPRKGGKFSLDEALPRLRNLRTRRSLNCFGQTRSSSLHYFRNNEFPRKQSSRFPRGNITRLRGRAASNESSAIRTNSSVGRQSFEPVQLAFPFRDGGRPSVRRETKKQREESTWRQRKSICAERISARVPSQRSPLEVLNSTKAIEVTGRNPRDEDETRCSSAFCHVRNFPTRARLFQESKAN